MVQRWLCVIIACLTKLSLGKDIIAPLTVSPVDLNVAVNVAENLISTFDRFEKNLAASGIEVKENSPSHGQFLDSYPTPESLELGKYALLANRASLYLVQKHCLLSGNSKNLCIDALKKSNMSGTPLEERCLNHYDIVKCEEHYPYRSYNGSCNHLSHPNWGLASTAYRRLLPPDYLDGISELRRCVDKKQLPSSRLISSILVPHLNKPERERTLALVQWTQFIGDDLFHTPVSKMVHVNKAIECCGMTYALMPRYRHRFCQSISIPSDDPDYSPHWIFCMNYVRSLTSLRDDCSFGPADQMNQNTHYLDGSMIYGSSIGTAKSLRSMEGGKLLTVNIEGDEFLPSKDCGIHDNEKCIFYKSGDMRANQHPHHAVMYTLWVREHNRIAELLSQINPDWDDETLYHEARKIVVAEIQHITYRYWVQAVLGRNYTVDHGLDISAKGFSTVFKENMDPRISNSFATAGLRFISSMFQSQLKLVDERRYHNDTLHLKDFFNKPGIIQKPDIFDKLVRGLSTQASQKMDASFIKDVTNYLFKSENYAMGLDIVSLDIERGRDHGLPGYNKFRKICNLTATESFETFLDTIPASNLEQLKRVYRHPNDVDLFVGAILEAPVGDGLLGPVLRCIIGEQMERTRNGDRFFYDAKGKYQSFKEGQIMELKKVSFARVICDNVGSIKKMQLDPFRLPSPINPLVSCDDPLIPRLNLKEWKSSK